MYASLCFKTYLRDLPLSRVDVEGLPFWAASGLMVSLDKQLLPLHLTCGGEFKPHKKADTHNSSSWAFVCLGHSSPSYSIRRTALLGKDNRLSTRQPLRNMPDDCKSLHRHYSIKE